MIEEKLNFRIRDLVDIVITTITDSNGNVIISRYEKISDDDSCAALFYDRHYQIIHTAW